MRSVLMTYPGARPEPIRLALLEHGLSLRDVDIAPSISEADLIALTEGSVAVIAGVEQYTRKVLTCAPSLRVIARGGVGYDSIDVEAATEQGIAVCTTPGSNDRTVAEYTVLALLQLARQMFAGHENLWRSGKYQRPAAVDLFGKTVGIVGTGAIGRRVAEIVCALGCSVLAHSPHPHPDLSANPNIRYVGLQDLLANSDFVTLHVPSTPGTIGLIGTREFERMKPTAYLVNTARGAVLDESAAYKALRNGQIAGACLDVFSEEPLPQSSPFRTLTNIILTPHMAGITAEAVSRATERAAQNVISVLSGQTPNICVNPSVLSRQRE